MYSQVKLQPLKNNKFKILEEIVYKDIKVLQNYETNGVDIPRIFWFFIPPNKSDILPAVIIHDFLCDKEEYKKADDYFEEVLVELGIKNLDRFLLVKSVRLYHTIKYKLLKGE